MGDKTKDTEHLDIQDEYDFSSGVRGKYTERFAKGTNIIVLDPDVAEMFPASSSVNSALRELVKIAGRRRRHDNPSENHIE